MLNRLPIDIVRAYVAPHLTDADVLNCTLAFRADNPVAAELADRTRAFNAVAAELEKFVRVVVDVLRQPSVQHAEQMLHNMPHATCNGLTGILLNIRHWDLTNGKQLQAKLWLYTDANTRGWYASIAHTGNDNHVVSVGLYRKVGPFIIISHVKNVKDGLVAAVERGVGIRRSARVSKRRRPCYTEEPSDDECEVCPLSYPLL